ncbi:aminoalkylphosphonic acid N-acetyltransferase [Escherichia coli]|nr:aminoalkylphosphonic acid N-acetyltransferase [Escherichia coli]
MPACELRPATQYDTDAVYALICELKQAEFDHQAFRVGFNANLRDPNMRYQLALLDGEVVGMIGLHLQFHLVNIVTELSTNVKRHDAHRFYLREGYEQSHFRFTKVL